MALCLVVFFFMVAVMVGLNLWERIQTGPLVLSFGRGDRSELMTRVLYALFAAGLFFVFALWRFREWQHTGNPGALCTGSLALVLSLYFLFRSVWAESELREGGFRKWNGGTVRWQDITSYQWTGYQGYVLIVDFRRWARGENRARFFIPTVHKGTVERYLANHL
jgi:hypothetical protein